MSDGISRIGNVRPTYPVKPVQPSEKERSSGQGQKPVKKRRPKDSGDDDPGPPKEDDRHTIDEFI